MRRRRLQATLLALFLHASGGAMAETSLEKAYFAGGCFWCMEAEFEHADGVASVTSGYSGGAEENPTYEQVSAHATGHAEAVEVTYDPAKISYEKLLEIYWSNVDPTDAGGQFYDRGVQYRTAIFYRNDAERAAAEASKQAMEKKLGKTIVTEITAFTAFYPAEEYHQNYYKKNAVHYNAYKLGSGRNVKLKAVWGKEN